MKIVMKNKRALHAAVKKLLDQTKGKKIYAFYGAMGAGKTTIIKALCEFLGATDLVSSPTFTLVNEYRTASRESLYHIDFYRIKKHDEVFDFGIEEYLSGDNYCFMEWPELVEDILPEGTVRVRITVGENEERVLSVL